MSWEKFHDTLESLRCVLNNAKEFFQVSTKNKKKLFRVKGKKLSKSFILIELKVKNCLSFINTTKRLFYINFVLSKFGQINFFNRNTSNNFETLHLHHHIKRWWCYVKNVQSTSTIQCKRMSPLKFHYFWLRETHFHMRIIGVRSTTHQKYTKNFIPNMVKIDFQNSILISHYLMMCEIFFCSSHHITS